MLIRFSIVCLIIITACSSPESTSESTPEAAFPLKDYVLAENDAFDYSIVETVSGDSWTEYRVRMVSGTWLTEQEVDQPEWWHWLNIVVPQTVNETEAMLIIGGGSAHDTVPIPAEEWMVQAALSTGSVIAHVSNIPFQPLDYKNDQKGGVYEDDLIAYGWRQYLESGASEDHLEWLARFPMTRAVVKAMDVVQEITRDTEQPVDNFFVAGAAKRGWTTWTTAAVDNRVIGISPIVIDLLNIVPSFHHHWRVYGDWSPAVDPYVYEGIMNWMDSKEFGQLLKTVGPYSFVDQLTIPKLLINATCDEFFVTDSWKFYWKDLQGESYLQYIPNSGHGLNGTYQPMSLISFYQAVISGTEIPDFDWSISGDTIRLLADPKSDYLIRRWEAVNPTARDFRIYVIGEAWQMEELEKQDDGSYEVFITPPESGYKAAMVEVVFNPESEFPLTFTS